jgi:hypothetical protein
MVNKVLYTPLWSLIGLEPVAQQDSTFQYATRLLQTLVDSAWHKNKNRTSEFYRRGDPWMAFAGSPQMPIAELRQLTRWLRYPLTEPFGLVATHLRVMRVERRLAVSIPLMCSLAPCGLTSMLARDR